jgi:ATP-dependent DNA helicase RecG
MLERKDIRTARDLLFDLPYRYEDFREVVRLGDLGGVGEGELATAVAEVVDVRVEQTFRRRVQRTTAYLRDESGEAEAIWFGRRFIERRVRSGDRVIVSGKVRHRGFLAQFDDPSFERLDGHDLVHTGRIVPVYHLTAGLTITWLRGAIKKVLDRFAPGYPEYLPSEVRREHDLPDIGRALLEAHFPETFATRDAALGRFAFDELLALQVGMVSRARRRRAEQAEPVDVEPARLDAVERSLEVTIGESVRRRLAASPQPERQAEAESYEAHLTSDQASAVQTIAAELAGPRPMLRLLQGDVGSGKTAVAAAGLAIVADAGRQGAVLAPTDLLARQHAVTLGALLAPLGHDVTLVAGALPAAQRRAALELIAAPPANAGPDGLTAGRVVVGTHALVQEAVRFADLAFVVVDEQHRFGVAERERLVAKGRYPHVLLMTATPIPRTLGQVFHADLDVTDLRTPPAGRLPIATGIRATNALLGRPGDPAHVGPMQRLVQEIAQGHRAFVVVPLVEDDPESGGTATAAGVALVRDHIPRAADRLGIATPTFEVGVVHGQMKAAERDAVMERFRSGEVNVLVGTTVLEVGVDVPEATVMLILDADRFGVAQLHQLRGRVGRGEAPSYCILVTSSDDATARARLEAIERTQDGFELAEQDLALRREGDVLGLFQSGLPPLRIATLGRPDHRALSVAARAVAERIVGENGALSRSADLSAFRAELEHGWLARVGSGEALGIG